MPNKPTYPLGYKVTHFRQARRLALQNSQAAGALWEFRWGTTAGHICYVKRITLKGIQTGANTAVAEYRFNVKVARSFTAVDGTNTASILRSGDNQKLNGDERDSVLTAFVESNAAAAAAGGTLTQDTDALIIGSYVVTGAAPASDGAVAVIGEYQPEIDGEDSILRFEQDEGFVVNLEAATQVATAFTLNLEVAWAEAFKP